MVTSCLLTARTGKITLLLLAAVPRRPCVTGEAWRDVGGTTRDGSCLSVYLPITFNTHPCTYLFIYVHLYVRLRLRFSAAEDSPLTVLLRLPVRIRAEDLPGRSSGVFAVSVSVHVYAYASESPVGRNI